MAMRPKIAKLARVIGGLPGMLNKLDETCPEYYALDPVVTDDMADVPIVCGLRKPRTLEYLAKKSGKALEETQRLCDQLTDTSVFSVWTDKEDGKDRFHMEIFAPGTLERMVGNRKQLAEHPEIGRAFEEYTRNVGAKLGTMLPLGASLMRVVPIESALEGIEGVDERDRLSYYIDKFDTFSVSDCSCRASRRILDEGCGHLEHEICLHLGPAAEFYARTGKARFITKGECLEIMHKAEENGLMHSMPNINEAGDSDSICNCCSCSCFGLRVGMLFGNRDAIRSNYVAVIDEAKCVACGQCVEHCPGNALKLGQKLCTINPLPKKKSLKNPLNQPFGKKDWNVDYRTNREDVVSSGTAPCKTACPAHIGIQGYLKLAAQGRYLDALELIKKENPFPAVCGRICNRKCEEECSRASIDEAVAIDEVKKFIADQELYAATRFIPEKRHDYSDKKIAIVGSGPAGLSCACYLALDNYDVTVFEKEDRLGGMLTMGIPSFRLEKDVIDAEIDVLRALGVKFKTGVEVGKDISLDDLRSEGYSGFYLAIGAQKGRKLGIPGEESQSVLSGVEFLKDVNLGKADQLPERVVVVGGGNMAIDVARAAIRQGAKTVDLYCLESEQEMPASADELLEAKEEGIKMHNGWGPMEILEENGQVKAIRFKRCTSVFNDHGRFAPVYDENETILVDADAVLTSIGQAIDWGGLLENNAMELNGSQTVKADPFTYQTAQEDIFVGGDCHTGPKFAIDAIAAGKEAAVSLHRYVQPGQSLVLGRDRRIYRSLNKDNIKVEDFDNTPRQNPGHKKVENRFMDERLTFTPEQIRKETARCLQCGATKIDPFLCIGCGQCTTKCAFDAIHLEKRFDVQFPSFEKLPIEVAKNAVKRTGRIIKHAVKGDDNA